MKSKSISLLMSLVLVVLSGLILYSKQSDDNGLPAEEYITVQYSSWRKLESLDALKAESDTVIVGTVTKVVPGRYESNDTPHLNASIKVDDVIFGAKPNNAVIVVEQVGGVYTPTHQLQDANLTKPKEEANQADNKLPPDGPPENRSVPKKLTLVVDGDPHYKVGEKVLLFLKWDAANNVYFVPVIQGRYQIDSRGIIKSTTHSEADPVIKEIENRSVKESAAKINK